MLFYPCSKLAILTGVVYGAYGYTGVFAVSPSDVAVAAFGSVLDRFTLDFDGAADAFPVECGLSQSHCC